MSALLTPPPIATLLTVEEFAALPNPADGSKQELVRGKVVTMPPPSFDHGFVQLALGSELRIHARTTRSGRVTVETGLVTETDPDTVRGPDVAYWSFERLPADRSIQTYPDVAADIVAEILTPSSSRRRIADKIREYFARGVRLVWVVDSDERSVTVYTQPGNGTVLWDDATLTGGDVLPGFSCPIASLFESI